MVFRVSNRPTARFAQIAMGWTVPRREIATLITLGGGEWRRGSGVSMGLVVMLGVMVMVGMVLGIGRELVRRSKVMMLLGMMM
jgi:hypothetical protein